MRPYRTAEKRPWVIARTTSKLDANRVAVFARKWLMKSGRSVAARIAKLREIGVVLRRCRVDRFDRPKSMPSRAGLEELARQQSFGGGFYELASKIFPAAKRVEPSAPMAPPRSKMKTSRNSSDDRICVPFSDGRCADSRKNHRAGHFEYNYKVVITIAMIQSARVNSLKAIPSKENGDARCRNRWLVMFAAGNAAPKSLCKTNCVKCQHQ